MTSSTPSFLIRILTHTAEGQPYEEPQWALLGDEDIDFLFAACNGTIFLGQQDPGHYLLDIADLDITPNICRAYLTAKDQYNTLVAEWEIGLGEFERTFVIKEMAKYKRVMEDAQAILSECVETLSEDHVPLIAITL
jgi:hypothetical protein